MKERMRKLPALCGETGMVLEREMALSWSLEEFEFYKRRKGKGEETVKGQIWTG